VLSAAAVWIASQWNPFYVEEVVTAGDPRTSENMGLLQMQVLFFREHNAQADRLEAACDADPLLSAMVDLRQRIDAVAMPEVACALDDEIARRVEP
jgi:hypothetical protein